VKVESVHPLENFALKVNRANEHLDGLRSAVEGFVQSDFYETATEFDYKRRLVARVKNVEQPPLELAVLIGDAVHNRRPCDQKRLHDRVFCLGANRPRTDASRRSQARGDDAPPQGATRPPRPRPLLSPSSRMWKSPCAGLLFFPAPEEFARLRPGVIERVPSRTGGRAAPALRLSLPLGD
jgi:hypothetical protein